ncbi:MASE1 domain-containing protein [Polynucleobacter sp. Nonnen-W13]|nr:MASE1 domain-containing protein [Polynucleobacter sp. Nonnen-W13]
MSYLPDFLINNDYSSFFYLPTGVKVLCVLVFDIWGVVGLAAGVLIRQSIQHPEFGLALPLIIALENAIVFWVTVKLALRAMGVGRDIENITYLKIVGLALFCSFIHGFSYTFVLFEFNAISSSNYLRESLVAVMAGFFGTMVTVLMLSFVIKHSPLLRRHMRAIEND